MGLYNVKLRVSSIEEANDIYHMECAIPNTNKETAGELAIKKYKESFKLICSKQKLEVVEITLIKE